MFKKLASFTGWLLLLSLFLVFCFIFGLMQGWGTFQIIMLWLSMLVLATILKSALFGVMPFIKEKKNSGLLSRNYFSHRDISMLARWKTGVNTLKKIRYKKGPLPWYLLIGGKCGKSTLLSGTKLTRFCADNKDPIVKPTHTIKWWFLRNIAVLDISSSFLSNKTKIQRSWQNLIQWIFKITAPSGIIIALSVKELMTIDQSSLYIMVQRKRLLIDPLINRYGKKLPLIIMVTQCDHFPGFSLWRQQLSASQNQHAFGYYCNIPSYNVIEQDDQTLKSFFSSVKKGMSQARISMAKPENLASDDYITLLGFPEKFEELEHPLRDLLEFLYKPSVSPFTLELRSIWFTSAESQNNSIPYKRSFFAHDIFSQHLYHISQEGKKQHRNIKIRSKKIFTVGLFFCLFWIAISSYLSAERLLPNISEYSPNQLATYLSQDENYSKKYLLYLPFQLLLNQQLNTIKHQIIKAKISQKQLYQTFSNYRKVALSASPVLQREYILQLANAILVWEEMNNNVSLDELMQFGSVPESLQQYEYSNNFNLLTKLAIERYYMQQPDGEHWRTEAKKLLYLLVNNDPYFNWLAAPSSEMPELHASMYWSNLPDYISLKGIWTQQGEKVAFKWMTVIEKSMGHTAPVFDQIKKRWFSLKQNAWLQFIIEITANLHQQIPIRMSYHQLIRMSQNNSPTMQFTLRVINELDNILEPQTQPWLKTLREINELSINQEDMTLLDKAKRADQYGTLLFKEWINGGATVKNSEISLNKKVWLQWINTLNNSIKDAIEYSPTSEPLTRGLFKPTSNDTVKNPLMAVFPAFETLKEQISPENTDVGVSAVWLLYQNDASNLLENAMAQSACWLNAQWKSSVIWPLSNNIDRRNYNEQLLLSQQLISTFLHRQAKTLLVEADGKLINSEYRGMKVALTDNFLRLAREYISSEELLNIPQRRSTLVHEQLSYIQAQKTELEQKLAELNKKKIRVTITSFPVTIPSGAKTIPIGTELTLSCQNGEQSFTSINFADETIFSWQPGGCSDVTLKVNFSTFAVHYQLSGEDSWPKFIKRFSSGESLLTSHDFNRDSYLLENMGINEILVRFSVSNSSELEDLWVNWSTLLDKTKILESQINNLSNELEELANLQKGRISDLPDDIAQCQ
ncbi:type VI secretion protein IcmF/TssM N-terminal domain-containing protein [Providencia rettgeri]|uniref:type VI secretion protein IcmF/TssM N-terminal domain-containing protein n=1 Tax=Providencia rettgeri TaxID=587 RepID=UPI0014198D9F|nr:type VI secretion protein IcmF/TssM N-terminal domain-containing protein [Providencia rettgeri]NIH07154.1 hypothetical protein [Providencia rettgeri]